MAKVLFTKEHEYVHVKGDVAYIGISDYAQEKMGDIVYVELPEVDAELEQGDPMGVVESVKSAADVFAPVSGTVVEVNEDLEDSPELLNEDAMENWICQIQLSNPSELDDLMDEEEYKAFCGNEE